MNSRGISYPCRALRRATSSSSVRSAALSLPASAPAPFSAFKQNRTKQSSIQPTVDNCVHTACFWGPCRPALIMMRSAQDRRLNYCNVPAKLMQSYIFRCLTLPCQKINFPVEKHLWCSVNSTKYFQSLAGERHHAYMCMISRITIIIAEPKATCANPSHVQPCLTCKFSRT